MMDREVWGTSTKLCILTPPASAYLTCKNNRLRTPARSSGGEARHVASLPACASAARRPSPVSSPRTERRGAHSSGAERASSCSGALDDETLPVPGRGSVGCSLHPLHEASPVFSANHEQRALLPEASALETAPTPAPAAAPGPWTTRHCARARQELGSLHPPLHRTPTRPHPHSLVSDVRLKPLHPGLQSGPRSWTRKCPCSARVRVRVGPHLHPSFPFAPPHPEPGAPGLATLIPLLTVRAPSSRTPRPTSSQLS